MTGPAMHNIAAVVASVDAALDGLFDAIEPDLCAFSDRLAEVRAERGDLPDDLYDQLAEETGYRALVDACDRLKQVADWPGHFIASLRDREEERTA